MLGVKVTITQYIDDAQPGWVKCKFVDANGQEITIIEKVPIVCPALDAHSDYPQSGVIACQIVERRLGLDGAEIVTVDLASPWTIEDITGKTHFDVFSTQLAAF